MFDVCVIGHITKDIIKTSDREMEMPGGTAYYTAVTLKNLGMNVAVITKLHQQDSSLLLELEKKQIPFFLGKSDGTTTFMNVYSNDTNTREQWVKDMAEPFNVNDASHFEAKIFHLGPLTRHDIPLEVIRFLSGKVKISVDVQGFVRDLDKNSPNWERIRHSTWGEKIEALSFVNILKTNEDEARVLSRERDIKKIAEELSSHGPEEVIITRGNKPSLVYFKGKSCWIPAYPPRIRTALDPTGCGDIFMGGYLFYRDRTEKIDEVGRFSAMTASLKLERGSLFKGNENDVRDFAISVGIIVMNFSLTFIGNFL